MKELNLLQLVLAKGVGESTIKKIYKYLLDNKQFTLDELCSDVKSLESIGMNDVVANNVLNARDSALKVNEKLMLNDVKMVWLGDDDYPSKLRTMTSSTMPPILFYKGNYNLVHETSIGFCGSRKVSESGLNITNKCVKQFIKKDFVIISGYANGVDIMSHKTALQEKGNTIFVLAEGILKCRIKSEIRDTLMDDNYLFISQFIPELTW
ncbi:MAG: DNA-processing protein DprA, partial [Mobilitalea sp.]